MSFRHVLAVVPVSDIDRANAWFEALFGRPAHNNPMPTLVEWRVAEGGWVQVTVDDARAGNGLLNFAVDDLDSMISQLADRGITAGPVVDANKGVRLSTIPDPDGNAITLIANFREEY